MCLFCVYVALCLGRSPCDELITRRRSPTVCKMIMKLKMRGQGPRASRASKKRMGIRSGTWLPRQEFERPLTWYYRRQAFVRCDMVFIPGLTMIGWSIQVIFSLLSQQFERLQCGYYWGRNSSSTPLRWHQALWYTRFHIDLFRHSSNVAISDRRDLWSMPLRCPQVA
jgi:hypothetical protein